MLKAKFYHVVEFTFSHAFSYLFTTLFMNDIIYLPFHKLEQVQYSQRTSKCLMVSTIITQSIQKFNVGDYATHCGK